jgi:predicted  nucleic acid-binding Zn-ribbon protein
MGDSQMKLSEQAKQDNHVSMLEMEIDKLSKDITELENRVDELEDKEEHLKLIIKSLSEVL